MAELVFSSDFDDTDERQREANKIDEDDRAEILIMSALIAKASKMGLEVKERPDTDDTSQSGMGA